MAEWWCTQKRNYRKGLLKWPRPTQKLNLLLRNENLCAYAPLPPLDFERKKTLRPLRLLRATGLRATKNFASIAPLRAIGLTPLSKDKQFILIQTGAKFSIGVLDIRRGKISVERFQNALR